MASIGVFLMENKTKQINWEKISTYFAGLAVLLAIFGFLNQSQRDISDLRERAARLEERICINKENQK
jgi:hypothetical protein